MKKSPTHDKEFHFQFKPSEGTEKPWSAKFRKIGMKPPEDHWLEVLKNKRLEKEKSQSVISSDFL